MKKKIICIGLVSIFVLTSMSAFSAAGSTQMTTLGDNLDQFQHEIEDQHGCYDGECTYAQSFRPSYSQLTRVKLYLIRLGVPSDVTLTIQTSRDSGVIASLTVPAEDLPDILLNEPREHFFVFSRPVELDIGEQYFIVLNVPQTDDVNCIIVYGASYWEGDHWDYSDHYPFGKGYVKKGNAGWDGVADLGFETYGDGEKNQKPSTPTIDAPDKVKEGAFVYFTFCSTDPEGSKLEYYVDWGDGRDTGWLDKKYDSGEEVRVYHNYFEAQKDIQIQVKTKDMFGEESDIGTHTITVTKTKAFAFRAINLLERCPRISQFLEKILGI
jgi:hypothetical protein